MRNTRIPTDTNLGLTFTNHIFVYWFHFFKFFVVYYITISIIEKVPEMSIFFYFFFEVGTGFEPVIKRGHLPLMGHIPSPSVLPYRVALPVPPPN